MVLDQLINDIRKELCLWSLKSPQKHEQQKEAWRRVARKNRLTAVEVQLIFRELTKKYKEEKQKPISTWNLFGQLKFLDENDADSTNGLQSQSPVQKTAQQTSDDDIYVELLEVHEEDFTDDESSSKSKNNESQPVASQESNESGNKFDCSSTTATQSSEKKTIVVQKLKRRLTNAVAHSDDTEILQPPEKQMKNTEKPERKSICSSTIPQLSNGTELNLLSSEIQSKNTVNTERKPMDLISANDIAGYEIVQPLEVQTIKLEEPDEYPSSNEVTYKEIEARSLKNKKDDDEEETTVSKHSKTYNSFGQYVASTLNSLPEKLATQLEIKILEAIIAANSDKVF